MSIDMEQLLRASRGDPNAKVAVTKKWLAEVHRQLSRRQEHHELGDMLAEITAKTLGTKR